MSLANSLNWFFDEFIYYINDFCYITGRDIGMVILGAAAGWIIGVIIGGLVHGSKKSHSRH